LFLLLVRDYLIKIPGTMSIIL